ncbi:hypothetical protein [Alloactinosynnema sp. L-07]|uniref:hypothetical protein n=1 Tax=Alloactinosynnema sp. L-07 TaxID=1653480 RepID=UPI00065EF83D|nr:hypothetical protein [Alloactinosynnema sp. L-07]CRK57927.1 hypothetical protein [Alloactinosynnema sp. L-07]
MTIHDNPFPNDPDRGELWEMLVRRDIDAFVAGDWSQVEDDFDADRFFAVDGRASDNPDSWRITPFDAYRVSWLEQSQETNAEVKDVREALFAATTLRDIEIVGDDALLHKKFDGTATRHDGSTVVLRWQTVYQCHKRDGRWRITGFIGYLPNPMGASAEADQIN